jgi:hypothetical protein
MNAGWIIAIVACAWMCLGALAWVASCIADRQRTG